MFDPISRLSNHLPFGGPGNSPLLSLAQSLTSSLAQTLGLGPNRFDGDHRSEHRPAHHHHQGPNNPADGGSRGDGPRETHDTPGSRYPSGPSQSGAPGAGSTTQTTQAALDRAMSTLATLIGQGASSSAPASQASSPQDALTTTVARQLANSVATAAGGAATLAGPAGSAQAFQAAALSGATALSTAAALAQAQAPGAAQAAAASGHAMGLAPGGMPAAATAAQAPVSLAGTAMPLAAQPPLARAEAQAAMARADAPGVVADRAGAFAANAPGTTASAVPAGATTATSTAPAAMAAAGATLATMTAPAAPVVPASQSPADVRGHTGLSMGGERSGPGRADGALAQGHTVAAAGRRSLYGGDGRGRSSLGGLFAMIGVGSQAARQELADLQKAELAYQWLYWVLLITAFASLGLLIVAVAPLFGAPVAYRAISQPGGIALLLAIGTPAGIGAWLLARRR